MLPDYSGAEVLITGGLGFLGSTLALKLEQLGAKVEIVDSLIPEYGGNRFNLEGKGDRITVHISDVRDEHSLPYHVKNKNYLFNLAGQTSHLDSMLNPFTDLDINCRAQLSILETCRKHNPEIKIVFAGTRQIYGRPEYLPVDENHSTHAVDVNGIHKLTGESYHLLYDRIYGIRTCSLRLTNTYGPRMRIKDDRQTFLGVWIRNLIQAIPLEIFGDGSQLRDFTYVDDAVHAFLLAGASREETHGQIFNVGGEERISLKDLADLMIEIHGSGSCRIVPFPPERKRIDIGDYYSDDKKLRAATGWKPSVTLRDGIARTLSFYQANWRHYC